MSCYHPRRVFYTGRVTENGARETVFASGEDTLISIDQARKKYHDLKPDAKWMKFINQTWFLYKYDEVPCGKCIGCKLDYSKDWATRAVLESKNWQHNWFLTITYDNQHYPADGELSKRDIQLFLKRLRKKHPHFRYMLCGEKGSITNRCHYHAIMFNLEIKDLQRYSTELYTSQELNLTWGKGGIMIGECNYNTAAYVARYVIKKQGTETAFMLTSRKPGIGCGYWEKNGQIIGHGHIYAYDGKGCKFSIPKYFKRKAREEDPETMEALGATRKKAMHAQERNLQVMNGASSVRISREIEETKTKHRIKRLKRRLD